MAVSNPGRIIDGLDLLAADFDIGATARVLSETSIDIG